VLVRRLLASVSVAAAIALAAVGCSSAESNDATSSDEVNKARAQARDFAAHPAIVEVDEADQLYALSDPHGHYEELVKVLAANHLIASASGSTDPTKVKWTGGTAILLVLGDLIDKGEKSLEVIDMLRTLERQAPGVGGRVIVTMGNHEAEFLADPNNGKATSRGQDETGINVQLDSSGVDPAKVAACKDTDGRGRWLADLPLGARVKKWFFAHGGNTKGKSLAELNDKLQSSLLKNGFSDDDIIGGESLLQSQHWYGNPKDGNAGEKEVDGLGHVKHIVFGHDPGAFDDRGRMLQSKNGLLVKVDVAMGLHEGDKPNPAFLLHIWTVGSDTVEVLDSKGNASPLED
jgi:hypothetical protein